MELQNFHSGDFGINLLNIPNNPTTNNTFIGDQNPLNLNDNLNGTSSNDLITGGAGNDTFNMTPVSMSGVDWLKGGAGNDLVQLASDAGSIAEGNAGSDYITANSADSKLFGDGYGEMDQLITAGETATGVDVRGDLIRGWTGNDYIYGAEANDALFGGSGKDMIAGGGGNPGGHPKSPTCGHFKIPHPHAVFKA